MSNRKYVPIAETIRAARVRSGEHAVTRNLHDMGICSGPERCIHCKEASLQTRLEDALRNVRLLWQNCCTSTEFNDGVKALVAVADEALEELKKHN
jgi:hypothetical protein